MAGPTGARRSWSDEMDRMWAEIRKIEADHSAELLACENRIERNVAQAVSSAVMQLMTTGEFRQHSCPHLSTIAALQTIPADLTAVRTSLEKLEKRLFNGEGAVPKLDARLREVETGMKVMMPFMPGPRSRGRDQLGKREGSDEHPVYQDRRPDEVPKTWKAVLMRVPWFVWFLMFVNVFTVLMLFAALAREPQMDNLERIRGIIHQEIRDNSTSNDLESD